MNDWLQQLIDWTSQQDYGWFIDILVWSAVAAAAWGFGNRREKREGWLVWLAVAKIAEAILELALYAANFRVPYLGWDFFLGLSQAVGIAALWWPLAKQIVPERPQLWRVMTVVAGVFLGVMRCADVFFDLPQVATPVFGGLLIALASAGGAWAAVRSATAVRVLGQLPPAELRQVRFGLFFVALLPIVSTFGPLAYALGQGRRWTDCSPFELVAAVANIAAGISLGIALWAPRLRAAPGASPSAIQRWKADLRLGFAILVVWLVLGLLLAVTNGRQARQAFEHNLLLRVQTSAALLDQNSVRLALNPDLKLGKDMRLARLSTGQPVRHMYVPWAHSAPFDVLRQQLHQLHDVNTDTHNIFLLAIRENKVVILVANTDTKNKQWVAIYRDLTPAYAARLAEGTAFLDGPFRDEWGAHVSVTAPVADAATGQRLGWLTMVSPATVWSEAFAIARLQSMAVTAIGVALWVLYVVYRMRRSEREFALQKAEQSAAADRAKSEFLAQVSHELRAPLQGIYGYTDLIEMTPLDVHQQDLLFSLRGQSTLMLRLVNDLVDLGALQAGAFRLNPEEVDLHSLVAECMDSVQTRAEAKGLKVSRQLDPTLPVVVRTDGARLRQVLLNLLGNAVKYTREGSIRLRVQRCEPIALEMPVPEWARFGVWVEFAVIDTGPGIAPEDQQRIFEPFVRLERDTAEQGAGLGLALTGRLCRALGGRVHVESDGEHGSSFIARLPLGLPEEPAADTQRVVDPAKAAWPGLRVLVADDNTLMRELLGTFLRSRGAQVAEARDGLMAVEECRERSFDLVLLDVSMPWLDGHAAVRRLRAPGGARGWPWIIGLSAHTRPEEAARARAEGMDCFLVKPMTLATLAEAISAAPAAQRVLSTVGVDARKAAQPQRAKLLEIYARETPRVVGELRGAAQAHDWPALRSLAHYLQNSADVLGAGRLQRCCHDLQFAAETAADDSVWPLLAAVELAVGESLDLKQDRQLVQA
jgi:signal transduction histidine kinase/DNA-binding NarL/FixJ family response regulator